VLFLLLLLLTYFGTLYQTENGLYAAQQRYFNSLFVVHEAFGVFPLPLPGGYLLLAVLFVNLLLGGLVYARKGWSHIGVMLTHAGILLLLVGCFVTFKYAVNGDLMLYEGETSGTFLSDTQWELAVAETGTDGAVSEFVIYDNQLDDASSPAGIAYELPGAPITLNIAQYMPHTTVRKAASGDPQELVRVNSTNASAPGAYAALLDGTGTEVARGIVWGGARKPLALEADGRRWRIELRNRQWQLPFDVTLNTFTRELYPGTQIPKVFRSDITKTENGIAQDVAITMNEPLREHGYTLYQSSWGPQNARPGDKLYSVFAVSSNPAEQFPLYACIVITLGLIIHFGQRLLKYLRRESAAARTAAMALLVVACLVAGDVSAQAQHEWSDDSLRNLATLPIQDGGRIKPLDTYANVTLLRLNGKRTTSTPDGDRIDAIEWLADCLFFPDAAKQYKTFQINNADVAVALGIPFERKRDRYAYADLEPAIDRLFELAREYSQIAQQQRNATQGQIIDLAHNIIDFEQLCAFMDFARTPVAVPQDTPLVALFPEQPRPALSAVLAKAPEIREIILRAREDEDASMDAIRKFLEQLQGNVESATLALLSPPEGENEWLTPQSLTLAAFAAQDDSLQQGIEQLAALEAIVVGDADEASVATFHSLVTSHAKELGKYDKIGLEVTFQRSKLFYYSLVFFVLGFIIVTVSWLAPKNRLLYGTSLLSMLVPTLLLMVGITMRSIIRERPPVTTLYETILFATLVAVIIALFIEFANRRRVMLSLAAILGTLGVFLANKYEISEGVDTMPSMIAVLDTNFWLATHVTTVIMGYGAAFLASAIAHLYVFGKTFRIKKDDCGFYRHLARLTYGVLCFSLVFTIIGTVLGGIWANESWGRFWGWDPKENGALMIVLWQLAVLHARLGGYIKDFGIALASIFTGIIVAFSWLGVNLLGVGLHSYGFTSGTYRVLLSFYVVQGCVLLLGAIVWTLEEKRAAVKKT